MGEKRFTMSYRHLSEVNNDIAIADEGVPCTQRQVCKLLNELNDENNELREQIGTDYNTANKLTVKIAELSDENEQLKKENEELKKIISKIDFAIIRKYDNSLENLLDEVYDGEYDKWIDKQVLRAKKLGGDVE